MSLGIFIIHVSKIKYIKQDLRILDVYDKIFKTTKPESEGGRNDGGKGSRDDGGSNRSILEVGPYSRTPPKPMGHDILEGNIVIKS